MKNLNACLASLNLGLPDDVRRLKEAGYYTEAIACIDTYLAEDWTKTQNQPVQPAGPLPENPTPRGVDAMRDALLAQRGDPAPFAAGLYGARKHRRWNCCRTLCGTLPRRNSGHWTRPVPWTGGSWKGRSGTSAPLPRPCWPPIRSWQHGRSTRPSSTPAGSGMSRSTSRWCAPAQSARDITLETSIGMSDEAFAAALAAAKQQGRSTVHVRVAAAAPGGLPGTERHHAGFLHRAADPHCTGRCRPAHGVLGGRPCREPALWRGVQLPYHGPLCRPAAHAGGPRAAGF